MYPVLFDFGFCKIYSWGFMIAVGVLAAVLGLRWRFSQEGYPSDLAFSLVLYLILSGILGARIGYIIVYRWSAFLAEPLAFIRLNEGGVSGFMWYGGLIAAAGFYLVYTHKKQLPVWEIADMLAPFLILGYAIARIGCFLAGCCYGKVTTSVLGVIFPVVDHELRYPTQLMSSGINLIFFWFLMYFFPRRQFHGQVMAIALSGYAVYRFIIECFRESEVFYGIFSPAQVISFGILAFGIGLYHYLKKRYLSQQHSVQKGLPRKKHG